MARVFIIGVFALLGAVGRASAQVVLYDGTAFPEEAGQGWTRDDQVFLADRLIENEWFVQNAEIADPGPPVVGEQDFYRRNLDDQAGFQVWFLEWVVESNGPEAFSTVAPASIVAGGTSGILYHFVIARDKVRLVRDTQLPIVIVDVAPGVPHTYRLELVGDESYRFLIDGVEADSGVPEGPFPTADSQISFGHRAALEASTTRWDRIELGAPAPDVPAASTWTVLVMTLLVMTAGTVLIRRPELSLGA